MKTEKDSLVLLFPQPLVSQLWDGVSDWDPLISGPSKLKGERDSLFVTFGCGTPSSSGTQTYPQMVGLQTPDWAQVPLSSWLWIHGNNES